MAKAKKRKKKSAQKLVADRLNNKLRLGHSRKEDKKLGIEHNYIYSTQTQKTYIRMCTAFYKWARVKHRAYDLDDAKQHVQEYLNERVKAGKSAWTVQSERAALAKLYGVKGDELATNLPQKRRANISNNRGNTVRGKNWHADNHPDIDLLLRTTGLRRSEAVRVRGTHLRSTPAGFVVDVVAGTKGGKSRVALVIGSREEQQALARLFARAGTGKVCSYIPAACNTHGYRRAYATNLYKTIAKDPGTLPRASRYHCRADKAGIVYDRTAMLNVSKSLGHNRIDIIASHYLDL